MLFRSAHIRALPPQSGQGAVVKLPPPVKALYGFGAIQDAAAKIDHRLPPAEPVPEGVTAEHGRYVANMCKGCHGPELAGGRIPGAPPDWPAAPFKNPGSWPWLSLRWGLCFGAGSIFLGWFWSPHWSESAWDAGAQAGWTPPSRTRRSPASREPPVRQRQPP